MQLLQNELLPLFSPDATKGVVRSLSSSDLMSVNTKSLVVNTYHLRKNPGPETLKKLGGIKKLMNWKRLIISDSGGFQLFSLINQNPDLGKITDEGVELYSGKNKSKKHLFTPEESIRVQFAIGSDIMVCLDDFTPPKANHQRIVQSVQRTVSWAERSKAEFDRLIEKNREKYEHSYKNRPLLIAPIQGHKNVKLRKQCAQELLNIEFDIYGLGGWPFDDDGLFDYDLCQLNSNLTPNSKLRFALGVGTPENIMRLFFMGYQLFDCVLPTRDARHQRLYVLTKPLDQIEFEQEIKNKCGVHPWYQYLYLDRGSLSIKKQPVSKFCDCYTCQNYSQAYLHHLFKSKDPSAFRLATIHNLRFYNRIMEKLGKENN